MVAVDLEEPFDHRSTRARAFAESKQHSGDSNHPDLESVLDESEEESSKKGDLERARELYAELRQMSVETGAGSIEDIMTNLNTSTESLSSIIPLDKRQELQRFEMSLKEMIEEAKQMANEAARDLDEYSGLSSEERRSRSVQSNAESVISVIERPLPPKEPPPSIPKISITAHDEFIQQQPMAPPRRSPGRRTPEITRQTEPPPPEPKVQSYR